MNTNEQVSNAIPRQKPGQALHNKEKLQHENDKVPTLIKTEVLVKICIFHKTNRNLQHHKSFSSTYFWDTTRNYGLDLLKEFGHRSSK